MGSVVTIITVTTCRAALLPTSAVIFPNVFVVRFSGEVAPTTSAVTLHQRQPISEATSTAPQVNWVQDLTCEASADFADRSPTNSFAVGTFKYNFVSSKGSVLNPTGGHFGEGEGSFLASFFFFFTGVFLTGAFFTGAFSLALAFGVGVGDLVAAKVEVRESERKRAVITAVVFILIALAPI